MKTIYVQTWKMLFSITIVFCPLPNEVGGGHFNWAASMRGWLRGCVSVSTIAR